MDFLKSKYFKRFLATFIDANLITIAVAVFLLVFDNLGEFTDDNLFRWNTKKIVLFQLLFYFPYFIISEFFFKTTVGKFFYGLKVSSNGDRIKLQNIFIKTVLKILPFNWVSFYFNKDKGFLHERASKIFTVLAVP